MTISLGQRQQFGQILVDMRLISQEALDEALMEQRLSKTRERLGALLLRRGMISAADYIRALARQHRVLTATR